MGRGHDLRWLDISDLDLHVWLKRQVGRTIWPQENGMALIDAQFIAHTRSYAWALSEYDEDRHKLYRRWDDAEPTVADVRGRMHWLCRLGRHRWHVSSVRIAGHQSSRTHVCTRCRLRGLIVSREEPRGYFGGNAGPMGAISVRRLSEPAPDRATPSGEAGE